jgi:hypothetical protein
MIIKSRNRDTAWYSMLDTEWLTMKESHEMWLDEADFGDEGRQRKSLQALRDAAKVR